MKEEEAHQLQSLKTHHNDIVRINVTFHSVSPPIPNSSVGTAFCLNLQIDTKGLRVKR